MDSRIFAAVDIGASGGRVMAGAVQGRRIVLSDVHRFPNSPVRRAGHLRWDMSALYANASRGLSKIPRAESIGIDTWGVDYGLLDADGQLLAEPVSYRDIGVAAAADVVHDLLPPERLFEMTGIQFLPFNTIYRLAAERRTARWSRVAHLLLLPDLLAYWLTGELRSELTNASTTGLLDVQTRTWSSEIMKSLDIAPGVLPALQPPGELRGRTRAGTPVVAVGSHDTASAVAGVPATSSHFAYVACGTWSLVGLELTKPVMTQAVRMANFSNELGVDGQVRFLRNVGGLWLLQECMRAWSGPDLAGLLAGAAAVPAGGPRINVDDPMFIPPGKMPQRIARAAGMTTLTRAQTVRCILDSLAAAFARTVAQAAQLASASVEVIHMVGGGSQNELLCQLTADAAGIPVVAGPVEATALGNVIVQARAAGALPCSLEEIRADLAASTVLRRYNPS